MVRGRQAEVVPAVDQAGRHRAPAAPDLQVVPGHQQLARCLGDLGRRVQRHDGVQAGEALREDRLDPAQQGATPDCRSQHRRLHDGQEQRGHQLQGHEPHQLLRHHPRPPVLLFCRPVLRPRHGSPDPRLEPVGRDGRSPADAERLLDVPGRGHRGLASDSPLLPLHRQEPHVLQVHCRGGTGSHPEVPDRAPRSQQREHRRLQQQEVLATRRPHAPDEARRQPRSSRLLGHQEQAAEVGHHNRVGVRLRLGLLQGQPQPALLHVGLRVQDPAQDSHHPRGVHTQGRGLEFAKRSDQGEDGAVLLARRGRRHDQVPQPRAPDPDGLGLDHLHQDRQQVEHGLDRPHDLLPRGRRQHPGAPRSARQVREQDPDQDQDRPELEDALAFPSRCLLHAKGVGRPRHALHGPRAHPAVRPPLVQAD